MSKKAVQLGMNPSTASNRLVKDTLFRLAVQAGYKFYRCKQELTRESFSIEHKEAWLDSDEPVNLYFDQNNIAFSHLSCNIKAASNGAPKKYHSSADRLQADRVNKSKYEKKVCAETGLTNRQLRYKRTGN